MSEQSLTILYTMHKQMTGIVAFDRQSKEKNNVIGIIEKSEEQICCTLKNQRSQFVRVETQFWMFVDTRLKWS